MKQHRAGSNLRTKLLYWQCFHRSLFRRTELLKLAALYFCWRDNTISNSSLISTSPILADRGQAGHVVPLSFDVAGLTRMLGKIDFLLRRTLGSFLQIVRVSNYASLYQRNINIFSAATQHSCTGRRARHPYLIGLDCQATS